MDAREILRFITHQADYDKADWLGCPQSQFKVRFAPSVSTKRD
jgi:hypothetical protein